MANVKGSIVNEHQFGLGLPYFDLFCISLVPSDQITFVYELHAEYVGLVETKTKDEKCLTSANGDRRFAVDFKAFARANNLVQYNSPRSGYKVKIFNRRVPRVVRHQNHYELPVEVLHYLTNNKDLRLYPIPASRTLIAARIGHGMIASEHIPEGKFICQYIAQRLTEAQFAERDVFYTLMGVDVMPPTDVHVNNIVFDGYADEEGYALEKSDNYGTQLNHCKDDPNCVMKRFVVGGESKLFLFAKTGIPIGRELVWNYDDSRRGLEPWLNK